MESDADLFQLVDFCPDFDRSYLKEFVLYPFCVHSEFVLCPYLVSLEKERKISGILIGPFGPYLEKSQILVNHWFVFGV